MRRTSGVQPTFQRTSTRASRRLPSSGLSPGLGECRVSWRFTRFGSPRFARGCGVLSRLRVRTGFPLTLPSEPPTAGPHERYRHSTTRSAFHRRGASGTGSRSSASATNVKVEHTRGRPVSPRASVLSAGVGHRRPAGGKAPVTRLGVELPLYRSPRLDQASARGTRGLLGIGGGHPCRTSRRPIARRGIDLQRAPRPVFDLPRER